MTILEARPVTLCVVGVKELRRMLASAPKQGRGFLPVLACAKVEDGELTITDLDRTLVWAVDYDGPAFLVPVQALRDAVKGAKVHHEVAFGPETDSPAHLDSVTVVVSGGVVAKYDVPPVDEYPRLAAPAGFTRFFPWAAAAECVVAASRDDARPILTGVYYSGEAMVATDSYRLHAVDCIGTGLPTPVLVPWQAIVACLKLKDATNVIQVDERSCTFFGQGWRYATRLIDGEFPNWRSLIPADSPVTLDLSKANLAPFVKAAGDATPMRVTGDDLTVTVSVREQDVSTVEATFTGSGPDFTVGFNPVYVTALLAGTSGVMHGTDSLKPWIIREDCETGTRIRLVMPVRVT